MIKATKISLKFTPYERLELIKTDWVDQNIDYSDYVFVFYEDSSKDHEPVPVRNRPKRGTHHIVGLVTIDRRKRGLDFARAIMKLAAAGKLTSYECSKKEASCKYRGKYYMLDRLCFIAYRGDDLHMEAGNVIETPVSEWDGTQEGMYQWDGENVRSFPTAEYPNEGELIADYGSFIEYLGPNTPHGCNYSLTKMFPTPGNYCLPFSRVMATEPRSYDN